MIIAKQALEQSIDKYTVERMLMIAESNIKEALGE